MEKQQLQIVRGCYTQQIQSEIQKLAFLSLYAPILHREINQRIVGIPIK